MKIIQINLGNYGSTGGIAIGINNVAKEEGMETYLAYPWDSNNKPSQERDIIIGSKFGRQASRKLAKITGLNGCFSVFSTQRFLNKVKKLNPDIIHLHNLHNSYINFHMLFCYIKKHNVKVIWTLHDCWAFTGRCPYFQMSGCDKWKTGCYDCPYPKEEYPSVQVDKSDILWKMKKAVFTGVENLTIITPSEWLAGLVKESFLSEYPVKVINNGIDLNVFKPTESDFKKVYGLEGKKLVLGVALGWDKRKGCEDLLELAKILNDDYRLILVGAFKEQINSFPANIIGIEKTNSPKKLAEIYSVSDVFINTTYEDNYPTVNLEARACGLPVITYKTGGSPESAGEDAIIVDVGDIYGLKLAIEQQLGKKNENINKVDLSAETKFTEYIKLYNSVSRGIY